MKKFMIFLIGIGAVFFIIYLALMASFFNILGNI